MYESWDEMTFGDMSDLSHRNPYVYAELLKLARWLIEEVGFDGFRYDFVKGYGANTITAFQEYRYMRDGKPFVPYGVAEFSGIPPELNPHWPRLPRSQFRYSISSAEAPGRRPAPPSWRNHGHPRRNSDSTSSARSLSRPPPRRRCLSIVHEKVADGQGDPHAPTAPAPLLQLRPRPRRHAEWDLIPGRGKIDFRPLLEALLEEGYAGFLSAELGAGYNMEPRTACRETLSVLRSWSWECIEPQNG